jgi:hypothetical protein
MGFMRASPKYFKYILLMKKAQHQKVPGRVWTRQRPFLDAWTLPFNACVSEKVQRLHFERFDRLLAQDFNRFQVSTDALRAKSS